MAHNRPIDRYWQHKTGAKRRGIKFLLTFDQWWKVWQDSGHWDERGCRRGQYVMSRPRDRGAYKLGNVAIIHMGENTREANSLRRYTPHTAETRRKIGAAQLGSKRPGVSISNRRRVEHGS